MNDSLENLLATQSFVLWIKGECSPGEKEYWEGWFRRDPEHRVLAEKAREVVGAVYNEYEIPDPHLELQKLNQKIDCWEHKRGKRSVSSAQKNQWPKKRALVAAGVFVLIALVSSITVFEYGSTNTNKKPAGQSTAEIVKKYATGNGEKVTFRLSDGSEIILNANSELRFSSHIQQGLNTEVWLNGEAYFDIARLEGARQRTFTVHTDDGSIQVLGTRFSVNTFGQDTQTALEEGNISIRVKSNASSGSATEYLLQPGELARFTSNDNKITVKEADTRLYTSWTEDRFVFKKTPVREVARRIEHTYGIDVMVAESLTDELLTGTIRSDSLEVLTTALMEVLHVKVCKKGRKLYIGRPNEQEM